MRLEEGTGGTTLCPTHNKPVVPRPWEGCQEEGHSLEEAQDEGVEAAAAAAQGSQAADLAVQGAKGSSAGA